MNYIFDGSYAGFLTAVFESFDRKESNIQLVENEKFTGSLFDEQIEIITDKVKSNRVFLGLKKILNVEQLRQLYWVFLSEDEKARNTMLFIIQNIFQKKLAIFDNFGDENVLYFHQVFTKVRRERHRMQAFIRFQKSNDGMYYCIIEPDFNVLPLITNFFKKRYADQAWLIYDIKRKYGLFYNLKSVEEVQLTPNESNSLSTQTTSIDLDEKENHYQALWQQYFKSTNIEARKNMKLHIQQVPKRYWKYLTEKQ